MLTSIKNVRKNLGISQSELSSYLNIPLKTIQKWEQGSRKTSEWIMDLVLDKLLSYKSSVNTVNDNSNEVLSYFNIKKRVKQVCDKYDIDKAYLFGLYVKGNADELSDLDLYIESDITGLEFFALREDLRYSIKKGIDLLISSNVNQNSKIYNEIINTGVLIYKK
ncbi:helix-turn-helix domain-containing protein [Mycoplasmatota bacterium WC30]